MVLGNLTTSGTLTVADVDNGEAAFLVQAGTAGSNGHGTFTLDAAGNWSYSAGNAQAAIQQLAAGATLTDSFTAVSADGSASQIVTVTITGTNDIPVIGGTVSGGVTEDTAVVGGNLVTGGTLTVVDIDSGQSSFLAQAGVAGSHGYGSFSIDAAGNWTYSAANAQAAIQQLAAGATLSDSFTATSADGTATQTVTVTITGTNDLAILGGTVAGDVTEDSGVVLGNLTTSGTLTVADVDNGEAAFLVQAGTAGSNGHGTFTLDAAGNWSYSAGNAQAAIQQLAAGATLTDSFTAVSADGSASQIVTVTITGSNDIPVIGGVVSGGVTEDTAVVGGNLVTGGTLTVVDIDSGQSSFLAQAGVAGSHGYGSFSIDAGGNWTYSAANAQAAIQQLAAGATLSDSFTATSADGTATQTVTVTITGTNDLAILGGTVVGDVTEDSGVVLGNLTTSGTLTVADVDNGEAAFLVQAGTAGSNGHGTFTLDAAGNWSYSAGNAQAAIQQLAAGATLTDSFTAVSADGSASQIVTVTITGTNDIPVIGGAVSGGVTEDTAVVGGNLVTGGTLTVVDIDSGQSSFLAQAGVAGSHGYGSFSIDAGGNWTYSAANAQAAIQQLAAGATLSDSFTATSADGTATQTVTVTITGTNDLPTVTADSANAVEAGGNGNALAGSDPTGNVLANDTDVDLGDVLSVTGVSGVAAGTVGAPTNGLYGQLTIDASGNFSYAVDNSVTAVQALRDSAQTLTDVFSYTVTDAAGGTGTNTLSITLSGANDAPVGIDDTGAAVEAGGTSNLSAGSNASGNVLTNDTDVDVAGEARSVSAIRTGAESDLHGTVNGSVGAALSGRYGSLTLDADGDYSYVVDEANAFVQALRGTGQTLSETFTYTVSDVGGLTANAELTITIDGRNDAPVGADDAGSAFESGLANPGGSNAVGNVLGNDADPDSAANGETLSVTAVAGDAVAVGTTSANGTVVTGSYGSLTLGANGTYVYDIDDANPVVNALDNGQTLTETFSYVVTDLDGASDTADLVITIRGSNDLLTVSPFAFDDVVNAAEAGGVSNGTGGIDPGTIIPPLPAADPFMVTSNDAPSSAATVTDIRTGSEAGGGALTSVAPGTTRADGTAINGSYGTLTIGADGSYKYLVDNSNPFVQALPAGQQLSELFTYVLTDAFGDFDSADLTIVIAGANDVPVVSGVFTAALTEDVGVSAGNLTAGSSLSIVDVDAGESAFVAQTTAGTYGSFVVDGSNAWTYVAANGQAAIQALAAGEVVNDVFTVNSVDGTFSQTVTISITGTNDAPLISSAAPAVAVTERADGAPDENAVTHGLSGTITYSDVDILDNLHAVSFVPAAGGYLGSFALAAVDQGADSVGWTFDVDDSVLDALAGGQVLTQTYNVTLEDGQGGAASQAVVVTLNGTNDAAVIGGTVSGNVIEAGGVANGTANTPTASGTLTAADVDNADDSFAVVSAPTLAANGYGHYTIDAGGNWSYALDNGHVAVQALNAGDTLTDSFSVASIDGTSQTISITIDGRNDAAVLTADTVGLTETNAVLSTSGSLGISDVDNPANFVAQAGTAGTHGSFSIDAAGAWSYTAGSAHDEFVAGTTYTDSFSVAAVDGTTTTVTINILGTNDAAVIGGTVSGNVIEAGGVANGTANTPTASGTLTAADVDNADDSFAVVSAPTLGGQRLRPLHHRRRWQLELRAGQRPRRRPGAQRRRHAHRQLQRHQHRRHQPDHQHHHRRP